MSERKLHFETLQLHVGQEQAALALRPSRACRLMPLVTTPPASLAAAQTVPPGHMQKV